MDFLDFQGQELYFDAPLDGEAEHLLSESARLYGSAKAETLLHEAYFLAPDNLQVHVALYRYYFYQHKLERALHTADITLKEAGARVGFPRDWREVSRAHLGNGAVKSMGLIRYYFLALKAAAYLKVRMGDRIEGIEMLRKVAELDSVDRLGAGALLSVIEDSSVKTAVS